MSDDIQQTMGPVQIGLLVGLALLWGASFYFVEILVDALPALTIVLLRVALAAALLWIVVIARGLDLPDRLRDWGALALVGALNTALPFTLITWGQSQIDSGLASILNATSPLFTVIIAGVALSDERFNVYKLIGLLFGIAGVGVLVGPDAFEGFGESLFGQVAVIAASLCYAIGAVYSRRFSDRDIPPLMVATVQTSVAALLLVPLVWIIDGIPSVGDLGLGAFGAMAGLAALSTALAYIVYFKLIEQAGATNAALVSLLVPVFAIGFGITLLGEEFSPLQIAGSLLVGLGLIVIDGRLVDRLRGKETETTDA